MALITACETSSPQATANSATAGLSVSMEIVPNIGSWILATGLRTKMLLPAPTTSVDGPLGLRYAKPSGRSHHSTSDATTFPQGARSPLLHRLHRAAPPHYVASYVGSLYQMAKVARRHNVRLYRPRFVYSAAETR